MKKTLIIENEKNEALRRRLQEAAGGAGAAGQ